MGGNARGLIGELERDWYCFKAEDIAQKSPTEAAHVGEHGFSQKCPDRQAIPLCGLEHHREGPESVHKMQKRFWARHRISKRRIIAALNRQFEMERAA